MTFLHQGGPETTLLDELRAQLSGHKPQAPQILWPQLLWDAWESHQPIGQVSMVRVSTRKQKIIGVGYEDTTPEHLSQFHGDFILI